jgi:hypothetical protein
MDAAVRTVLIEVTRLLADAEVPFQVGGSALLHALGLVDRVGDLDLVFRADDRRVLGRVLQRETGEAPAFDVTQEPGFVSTWRAKLAWRGVELDMTGEIALRYPDGFVARIPFTQGSTWDLGGVPVPLAPPADWLLVYRYHNPSRAALLEPFVPAERWRELLLAIGARHGFDGTVPVTGLEGS